MLLNIGCHLSVAKGFYKAGLQACEIGANTFQFFTRNPRGGKAKALDTEDIDKLKVLMREHQFSNLCAHASYTMNLCSNNEDTRDFAKQLFRDDLKRLKQLPRSYYIFHPGSHVKQGSEKGIEYIISALNEILLEDTETYILLETMAGKGSEVGRNLNEIKNIIDGVKYNKQLGVCLDTCHLYSSGYDLKNNLNGVVSEIDKIVGLEKVKAMHLNDSKTEFASFKDRHEKLGEGSLGWDTIESIVNHTAFENIVFNLETPNELEGYKREIEIVRNFVTNN
ncbi:MAG: deoxyribonuclease IV [Tissierellales bacterium]|jgi:deoxyribonuclease-4|nr:deoxyribonuclease IV [Tissierellales bacterium]